MSIIVANNSYITFENLIKIKHQNLKEFEREARYLAHLSAQQPRTNWYLVLRIAKELQEQYFDVEDIENLIISSHNAHFIFKFAKDIKNIDVKKLQTAIINTGDLNYIARFGCFVDGSDTDLIENIIIQFNNPRAAYIYLKYGKYPNVQKLKHIFLKSKKPRYLYLLAQLISDPQELLLIQDLIIAANSNMYVRLFAANIPGADIKKLEDRILETKNFKEIQKFAKSVNSDRINKLIMLM